jgi:Protein of unknown function (DUF3108)
MRRTVAALLVALAGAAQAATPPPPPVTLHYDVRYGPLTILSLDATIRVADTTYRSTTRIRTEGVVRLVYPWTAEAVSDGMRDGATLTPRRHTADGVYLGEHRRVRIEYAADGSVASEIEPPPAADARDGVPPDMQRATIDPLTASLAAVSRQPCEGILPVFDGRRRYDMRLEDRGPAVVEPARDGVYAGVARRCRATIVAYSGFWRSDPRDSEVPTTLDYFVATPRDDIGPVPVYLELSGARGTLRIHLTSVERVTE